MAYQFCFCPHVLIFAELVCLKQTNGVQRRNPPLLHMIAILKKCTRPLSAICQANALQKLFYDFAVVLKLSLRPNHDVRVVLTYPLKNNGRLAFLHPQTSKTHLNIVFFPKTSFNQQFACEKDTKPCSARNENISPTSNGA